MSTATASTSPPSSLADVLERLRAVMAEERRAISSLDLTALEAITTRKRSLSDDLAATRSGDGERPSPALRRLIARVRVELGANAALIAAASDAIAAALGVERDDRYDRAARCHSASRPLRVIAL